MATMHFAQLSDLVKTDTPSNSTLDPAALFGNWINSNPETGSIARIQIFESNGKPQLRVSAVGPDGLIDWGATNVDVFAAGPASHLGTGFTCTFDFGFAEARLQGMIMKGLLVLAQFHLFKDNSKRAGYFLREYYAKAHDHF